jgi:hypothetical protein
LASFLEAQIVDCRRLYTAMAFVLDRRPPLRSLATSNGPGSMPRFLHDNLELKKELPLEIQESRAGTRRMALRNYDESRPAHVCDMQQRVPGSKFREYRNSAHLPFEEERETQLVQSS